MRAVNGATGAAPYDSLMVADVGDIPVIPYNTERSCKIIKEHMSGIIKDGCRPISVGGDHLVAYPILQAIKVNSYRRTARVDVYSVQFG